MAISTGAAELPRRSRVAAVLIAVVLAIAIAVLLAQARAVVGDPTALAPADHGQQLGIRIRLGSDRGQVRIGPSVDHAFAGAPHTASQRPKWVT